MDLLIDEFPRQLGTPQRQYVETRDEFYDYVDKYNGISNLYYSVYSTTQAGKFKNVDVNKVFFDFDGKEALDDARRLSQYCIQNDLKHTILFSGRKGFHVYIFTKNYDDVMYQKGALHNTHVHFEDVADVTNDYHVVGDIVRIARIPNTKHLGSDLFCRPVTRRQLFTNSFREIKEIATEQEFNFKVYGDELFNIKQFDERKKKSRQREEEQIPTYDQQFEDPDDELLKQIHPAVRVWLLKPEDWCTNQTRYFWCLYCKTKGIPKKMCDKIAKKHWSDTKETGGFRSKYEEMKDEKQIRYAYRSTSFFPELDTLCQRNMIPGTPDDYPDLDLYYEGE